MRVPFITMLLFPLLFPLALESIQAQEPPSPVVRPDEPDLSEQMVTIQLRHIKLWFAGKLGNWKLAAYQLDHLASKLAGAAKSVPAGFSADDMARQINSVRSAIGAKDLLAFTKAYWALTNSCNACHRAAGRGFISMQVPAISPFTDQDFADQVAEGRAVTDKICGTCHAVPDKPNASPSLSFPAPSFAELVRQPSFTESNLRQLLTSEHRRVGSRQAMLNPRLNDNQIDTIIAYLEALKLKQNKP